MTVKTELKLKAIVDNPEKVKKKVAGLAKFTGVEEEIDYFYTGAGKVTEFRIRKINGKNEIVFKAPNYIDGVQRNQEFKFRAESGEDFAKLIELFGFKLAAIIKKKCDVYEFGKIAVRISEVERLGSFIELTSECLADCVGEGEKVRASEMNELLKSILGEDAERFIDNRYYGVMLGEGER